MTEVRWLSLLFSSLLSISHSATFEPGRLLTNQTKLERQTDGQTAKADEAIIINDERIAETVHVHENDAKCTVRMISKAMCCAIG